MQLKEVIEQAAVKSVSGALDTEISGICFDSRQAGAGSLFCALPGENVDGHAFIAQAIENGAAAVLSEKPCLEEVPVPWVQVSGAREAMAMAADTLFGHPSRDFPVVGVTGTNGKSTTAWIIHHLMSCAWRRAGLVGTIQYQIAGEERDAVHTTPESSDLQALLSEMRDADCRGAVMEVSSHGLVQHRVTGVKFAAAVFTNLTRDHLDFHGSMDSYFASKRQLFVQIEAQGCSGKEAPVMVINRDDRHGERLAKENFPHTRLVTYGMGALCDFRGGNIRMDFSGMQFQLHLRGRQMLVKLPLIGRYNAYNALASLAVSHALDLNLREAVRNLEETPQVPGRLEAVGGRQINYRVYVDYAHTDDALENALKAVRELQPRRVITVFGCGGDRDRGKRPKMARAADNHSDLAILTSDNPRTEDPAAIIEEAKAGFQSNRYAIIEDRREAISEAIRLAGERDIVLIAGKGHENYQEIDGVRHPFDDRKVAKQCIAAKAEGTL